ncbi:DNA-binding MarR family transcriptional regulator [Arthrobacter silviterrae]|uniref:MarR family transcriptional regulator n=1 Tax=Arthrobacter silviterrae TaxID=2026658 RepID=A0ABX0DF24_9MICC|nr:MULTISPECIES: MarR family transcriptional regulator [Arthrobacter]MCU6481125.1 MarR family transcriptional regulator [Arthrobacter sp. A2-55]MDQ0276896.1 DNA-binding MarR family transcriptional regulator [Arthrobacter silviterrae]NGN82968.1 MarR family transcriptional regulator [Arthrobacter silviterrae]
MMSAAAHRRLAAESWESLLRAQVAVMRELHKEPIFKEVGSREYDVLFNLSRCPTGWLRLNELNDNVLLTQPSISRLVDRLEERGLVRRKTPDDDRRGVLIGLTEAGAALQKKVGRAHVQNIMHVMEEGLTDAEMQVLLELTGKLRATVAVRAATPTPSGK